MTEKAVTPQDRDPASEPLTVVFLHHFGGSSRTWREVISRLSRSEPGIRCLAPDLRGFGESADHRGSDSGQTTGPSRYQVDDYAGDVAGLLWAEGINRFLLVGHSMGGKIALALAARRPAGLRGVLLVAPSPPSPEPMSDDGREQLKQARLDSAVALTIVSNATFQPLSEAIRQRTVADILRSSPEAWRAWLEVGSREDISARMSQIELPVVVLGAGHDAGMTESLLRREIIERIAGSRIIMVPDSGHLIPLDAPSSVVGAVRDMIASVTSFEEKPAPPSARLTTDYPPGSVAKLLSTDAVSEPTRRVLLDRLNTTAVAAGRFLDAAGMQTLQAACARLIPQSSAGVIVDIAGAIDVRLASGLGDGWRYDALPQDGHAYQQGLRGIDEAALVRFAKRFCYLGEANQDQVLLTVQHNRVAGGSWTKLPPNRFFEELLAEASEIYFSHPMAQERIGYAGMADHHGWTQIALNTLDPQEPRPTGVSHG